MPKLDIGAKLVIAFGAVIVFALVAAIVGWFGYAEVGRTQRSVIHTAIPAMREAQKLAELNTQIIATSTTLTRASTQAERIEIFTQIELLAKQLHSQLLNLDQHGFDRTQTSELRLTIKDIIENLERQNDWVARKLVYQTSFSETTAGAFKAIGELADVAESLVANSAATTTAVISNLYDLVDTNTPRDSVFEVLDRLVEVDIDSMERMFELQQKEFKLSAVVNELSLERDTGNIDILSDQYRNILSILNRRLADINDPGRQRQAAELISKLAEMGTPGASVNIFELRKNALVSQRDITQISSDNSKLANRLNIVVGNLVASGGSAIDQATGEAEDAVRFGRDTFIIASVVAVILLGPILWFYLQYKVVRRLRKLETTTLKLAGGEYAIDIDTQGDDELSSMANALQVFRTNAKEKLKLEDELLRYQQNLEQQVSQRTSELESANRKLSTEARNHAVAREQAEQANRAKTRFLATMGHELRTPMNGILGTATLLQDTPISLKQSKYVDVIRSAGSTLLHILNDILGYSQMEAGKLKLESASFNLVMLIDDMLALMQPPASEKGLTLNKNIDPDLPISLTGDPGKLHQILLNLIGNAIKFTEQGSVVLNVVREKTNDSNLSVEMNDQNAPQAVTIQFEISDTGIGIPPKQLDYVFDAFTQVDTSTARLHGGIGLGLAICKQLVDSMKGEIGIRANQPHGTKIWFRLPFEKTDQEKVIDSSINSPITEFPELYILIVEDDRINQMVLSELLEKVGCKTKICDNAIAALNAVNEDEFDIVLMDIGLPNIDGVEATSRIRKLPHPDKAAIPIIAISAHVFKEEIDEFLTAGMNGFIGKPIDKFQLFKTISQVLNNKSSVIETDFSVENNKSNLITNEFIDMEFLRRESEELGRPAMTRLAQVFCDESDLNLSRIEHAFRTKSYDDIHKLAHRLKGSAANFGLLHLCSICADIENISKISPITDSGIKELINTLTEQTVLSQRVLRQEFGLSSISESTNQRTASC